MAVAGQFYPDNCNQVKEWFKRWKSMPIPSQNFYPKALIVPHAGYMYSGACAYKAYAQITQSIKHTIIIAPSHRVRFDGASVGLFQEVQTPCGSLVYDTVLAEHMLDKFPWLSYIPQVHIEHASEVQFPFIKECIPSSFVTEIIYGSITPNLLSTLIRACVDLPETLVVISTDLSHFYPLDEAKKLDNACIKAVDSLHVKDLEDGEACGMIGIASIILLASERGWDSQILDYCTSFDQTGDKSQVVGYMSAILG
jgi:hypothetical protein